MAIEDIRKEYTKATLDISSADANPIVQFNQWFKDALSSKVPEPNAMNLATVSPAGKPSSRIVLLKGVENDCFIFYTNYQSTKGKELEENPSCALTFFWPELERQIRIEGIASRISEERSVAYFQSRPKGSQIGAWASPQSSVIGDRSLIEKRAKDMEEKFKGIDKLPKPKQWGGFEVQPFMIEFWQGRASRLHDRVVYRSKEGAWTKSRLAP